MTEKDLDPFTLFCAYHLGITEDNTHVFQNLHDVARRFSTSPDEIKEALETFGMSPERILHSDFDLASAQADIALSPPGVDLFAIAEMHFSLFQKLEPRSRNWQAELDEAQAENDQIYGQGQGHDD
jgi:hypothetical protein